MKRSLAISFAIVVTLTILTMGQSLYAQKVRTQPTPIPRTLPAPAPPAACCAITSIDTNAGVVTAKVNANGNIFRFKVTDAALLNSLKVGQAVYATFTSNQVSLDGTTACCAIISPPAPPPVKAAAPNPAPPPPPLPPAGGTSGNSPASPPTKTNPPPGSGGATTQPGLKLETKPGTSTNALVPMEDSTVDPNQVGARQNTSFTVSGPCTGSISIDSQSSSLNVEADWDLTAVMQNTTTSDPAGLPVGTWILPNYPGCTIKAEFYKGAQLQNGWSITGVTCGETNNFSPPPACAWTSKPSGKSLQGGVSITVPQFSGKGCIDNRPCPAADKFSQTVSEAIIGHVVIGIRGPQGLNPYPPPPPPQARLGATQALSRFAGPGTASSTGTTSPSGTAPASNPVCAGPSTLEGVDVNQYQGTIDWNKVRASGRTFAYAKATDGAYLDTSFAQNYAAIKAAGLIRGASHFFHPDQDPVAQANLFMSTMGTLQPGDLPPALDVEITGGLTASAIVAGINSWITYVKAKTGLTPILYSAAGFLSPLGSTVSTLSNYPLWAANWNVSCPTIPSTWQKWVLWQYSDAGTVPGIQGQVDLNRFNGTLADLNGLARLSSSQQQPPSSSGTSTSGTTASNVSPVINEIETDNSTLHQFIELFNPGGSAYDLKGHCVVFRSATATNDTLLVSFKTTTLIPSKGYFLLALPNSTAPTPNATYSSPIASAGGVVALRDGAANTGSVIDSVAYGSASNPFLQTASAPSSQFPGTSISRLPNGSNTHNNSMDFKVTRTPTPGHANQ
jgi:GH25 family lysozyme M1 (1,4-beta-N-acetylmuramidase)